LLGSAALSGTPTSQSIPSLSSEIEAGLRGSDHVTIPGNREQDKKWAFKRSVPTMVLYDEQGLRLYDQITANAHEYYLFPDELNLLKDHGMEIAKAMGFPGREEDQKNKDENEREEHEKQPSKPWKPAKWGDTALGKYNNGVNGEEGLGGGPDRGWDVVELGAGALRKTGHLLSALAASLPAGNATPQITYHPLDLSYPELHRVLGEMDEAFGARLKGNVECIGLHGDYNAGLEFIREGKLPTLRENLDRGRGFESALQKVNILDTSSVSIDSPASIEQKQNSTRSPSSAQSESLVTPGPLTTPLPSAISSSSSSQGDIESGGTWSPVDDPCFPTRSRPLHIVFLGSSIGNFSRESAGPFLRSLPLKQGDTLLIGIDGRPIPGEEGNKKVEVAYNDPRGYTKAFEEHGWDVVKEELGVEEAPVEFVGRYNDNLGRHESYFRVLEEQTLHLPKTNIDVKLEKDELLHVEWSYKYSQSEALDLFQSSDLRIIDSWKASSSEYRLYLLERPSVRFDTPPNTMPGDSKERDVIVNSIKGVPKWEDWLALWKLWDHITLDMISKEMLHQKPIDLRHICLFYLGHIPGFLDIHLTRLTGGKHTEPEYFKDIFERGIDPDVDDPTKIHSHSEVPSNESDWPSLDEILGFRDRVYARLRGIYDQIASGEIALSRHMGRVLWMTHAHQALHAETLLYMLIQSDKTRKPTIHSHPQWDVLSEKWKANMSENKVLELSGGNVVLGHDDLEEEDGVFKNEKGWENHEFGWDNEHPKHTQVVRPFKIDTLPITNIEYLDYLKSKHTLSQDNIPASWKMVAEEEPKVRTLYGPVAMSVAGHWPLMASKVEIEGYCKSKGGRLPTEPELKSLWESEEGPKPNGQLSNIGFRNWHPIPPTNTTTDHAGRVIAGHNGGVWNVPIQNSKVMKDSYLL